MKGKAMSNNKRPTVNEILANWETEYMFHEWYVVESVRMSDGEVRIIKVTDRDDAVETVRYLASGVGFTAPTGEACEPGEYCPIDYQPFYRMRLVSFWTAHELMTDIQSECDR